MEVEGHISALRAARVITAHHVGNTAVASEIVGTKQSGGVWDVQQLNERVSDISDIIHYRGGLYRPNNPKVMVECKDRRLVVRCVELQVHRAVQNASRSEQRPDDVVVPNLVRHSGDLRSVSGGPNRTTSQKATYLLRGVHDITVSKPAVYFQEFRLVRKVKLVGDDAPRYVCLPFRLITFGEPVFGNVCVVLDFVGIPIVCDEFYSEVRKRDRLVH